MRDQSRDRPVSGTHRRTDLKNRLRFSRGPAARRTDFFQPVGSLGYGPRTGVDFFGMPPLENRRAFSRFLPPQSSAVPGAPRGPANRVPDGLPALLTTMLLTGGYGYEDNF
jgi:hypothetical protein